MKNLSIIVILFCGLYSSAQENAQFTQNKSKYDLRITRHYTENQLDVMSNDYPEKFENVKYYFLKSYKIERLNCEECGDLPLTHYDVAHFEKLRKKDEAYVREYRKYGYKVTLFPLNALTSLTPVQEYKLNH